MEMSLGGKSERPQLGFLILTSRKTPAEEFAVLSPQRGGPFSKNSAACTTIRLYGSSTTRISSGTCHRQPMRHPDFVGPPSFDPVSQGSQLVCYLSCSVCGPF